MSVCHWEIFDLCALVNKAGMISTILQAQLRFWSCPWRTEQVRSYLIVEFNKVKICQEFHRTFKLKNKPDIETPLFLFIQDVRIVFAVNYWFVSIWHFLKVFCYFFFSVVNWVISDVSEIWARLFLQMVNNSIYILKYLHVYFDKTIKQVCHVGWWCYTVCRERTGGFYEPLTFELGDLGVA